MEQVEQRLTDVSFPFEHLATKRSEHISYQVTAKQASEKNLDSTVTGTY